MVRRAGFPVLLVTIFASTAWAKINKNDQAYFDEKVQEITQQMVATQKQLSVLAAQFQTLSRQLNDMQKAEADLHQTIQHQGESLNDMLESLNIMRQSHSTDMGSIQDRLNVLSNQVRGINSATRPATASQEPTASPAPPIQVPAAPGQVDGYVTAVNGVEITVGLGSNQGIRVGSKLALYKKDEPRTQVGELEVTGIIDGSNSHARILTLNNGTQPDFNDKVRLESQ